MTRDSERLAEMAGFLGQRLNSAIRDVIPPEAQIHLLNAQRELITAVFLIYEHQVAARRGSGGGGDDGREGATESGGRSRRTGGSRRRRSSSRASRVTRIPVD